MPHHNVSPDFSSTPPIAWSKLHDDDLASWLTWLSADLDRWLAGDHGYMPKRVDEDLLAAAHAERERRQEVRLDVAS